MTRLKPKRYALAIAAMFCSISIAEAASLFDDTTLEGHKGPFLVIKDNVNYRDKPDSNGKALGKLSIRDTITVKGRAKGTQWFAISKKGKELGYVYSSSITPMLDGSLEQPLSGTVDLSDEEKPACEYNLSFEGRAIEEEAIFVSADYQATFNCTHNDKQFDFSALMFMSEVPPDLGNRPIYQITINLPDIATGYEEFLSATSIFNLDNEEVTMDAVSLEEFKEKSLRKSLPAKAPTEALDAAINLQLASFNQKAWRIIAGDIPNPSEPRQPR